MDGPDQFHLDSPMPPQLLRPASLRPAPFVPVLPPSPPSQPPPSSAYSFIVILKIGGELFQTTTSTLSRAGAASPLSALTLSPTPLHFLNGDLDVDLHPLPPPLLPRHDCLPFSSTLSALLAEATSFSFDAALLSSLSDPSLFSPFALLPSSCLPLPGQEAASALSFALVLELTSLIATHGGKLAFDAALASRYNALTLHPAVDSLAAISPSLAAAGAHDFPGIHLCRFSTVAPPSVLT